jgi:putative PEP-CTERM system histidine kinase
MHSAMTGDIPVLNALSFGIAGFTYSVYGLRLLQLKYLSRPRELSKITVLLAVVCSAVWGWLGLALTVFSLPSLVIVSTLADVGRYGCWYAFMLSLLRTDTIQGRNTGMTWAIYVAVALVAYEVLAISLTVIGVDILGDNSRAVLLGLMALPVFAMILLEQVFRNISEDSRWNFKPMSLGLAATFLFDIYLYSQSVLFKHMDRDAMSIRGAVHAMVFPLLMLSSTRRVDWISQIKISPKAAFHSATLLIAGVYLVFISSVGYYVRYFGGDWGRALQQGLVFIALIVLVILGLSGSMQAKLRVALSKHFFRYRFDYREEWLKFTHTLSATNTSPEMGQQVIRGLADMLESPAGGLWLRTSDELKFSQTARWNLMQTFETEPFDTALIRFMNTSGWVINLEEFRSCTWRYGGLVLPNWLQELPQAWLVVPLMAGNELIGFVVLASARTRVEINWEINDLLKTAGQQAASYLVQMRATEALLEARKFDAFNRMSAFVVHDLKNIVTQLSLMMKNARRLGDNKEFQEDMLLTVENALGRMRQLMLQLREGSTPPGSVFGVDLEGIIRRIQANSAGRGRHLEAQFLEVVVTRGHEERLERIIGHVVQNAFDATDPGGRVWLRLDRCGSQARIVVGDNGKGMSGDFIRDRLFKPFQTTKQAGMGIGAYESFHYVRELGGSMDVQSELNRGTTITILLPLFESRNEPNIQSLEAA